MAVVRSGLLTAIRGSGILNLLRIEEGFRWKRRGPFSFVELSFPSWVSGRGSLASLLILLKKRGET